MIKRLSLSTYKASVPEYLLLGKACVPEYYPTL